MRSDGGWHDGLLGSEFERVAVQEYHPPVYVYSPLSERALAIRWGVLWMSWHDDQRRRRGSEVLGRQQGRWHFPALVLRAKSGPLDLKAVYCGKDCDGRASGGGRALI